MTKRLYKIILFILLIGLLLSLSACGDKASDFTFAFISDTQEDLDYKLGYNQVGKLVDLIMAQQNKPEILLIGGDIVNDGNNEAEWKKFFEAVKIPKQVKVAAAVGNHDNSELQKEQLAANTNVINSSDNFFAITQQDVLFIILDSNEMGAATETSLDFLENTLKQAKEKYKVVMMHHPAYTVNANPKDERRASTIKDNYVPIMEKYGVDLVLCGHQHTYMRTVPLVDGQKTDDGIVYVMTVSGNKFYAGDNEQSKDYIETKLASKAVFVVFSITKDGLKGEARTSDNKVIDSFMIEK